MTAPTRLSISHPLPPRKPTTWTGPLVPLHATQIARPAIDGPANHHRAFQFRRTMNNGNSAAGQTFVKRPTASERPADRSCPRRTKKIANTAVNTAIMSVLKKAKRARGVPRARYVRATLSPHPRTRSKATSPSIANPKTPRSAAVDQIVPCPNSSMMPRVAGGYSTWKSRYGVPSVFAIWWYLAASVATTIREACVNPKLWLAENRAKTIRAKWMKMSRAIHPTSWGDRVEAGTLARRRSLSTVSASNVDEPFGDRHPDQSQGVFTKQSRRLYSPLHMVRMLQIRYAGLRIRL